MNLDVLLIRPPVIHSSGRVGSNTACPPLGVAYIAAYLRDKGINVSVLDAFGESPFKRTDIEGHHKVLGLTNEEIVDRIPDAVHIIGISCIFSDEWFYVKDLLFKLRERFTDVKLVIGGDHATALPHYIMESCSAVDYIVLGEGEIRFFNLLTHLFSNRDKLEDIEGVVYRCNNTVKMNHGRGIGDINIQRIRNIDSLPFPAWDLIPVENYLGAGLATIASKGKRIMPILSSRGCPYSCKFCSNNIMWGTRYIVRDCRRVVEELKRYTDEYRIDGFEFHDLTTIIRKEWIMDFCKMLIEENLNLEWNIPTTRAEVIDAEVIEALEKAGCTNICLTPDSGSKFQLDDMNKRVDLERITECSRQISRAGLVLKVNLVIGFPHEKHRNIWRSLLYGIKLSLLGAKSVMFYRFVPYPGSEYFEYLRKNGKIPKFGPEFDAFLSINTYNELSKVYSFSNHVSDFAIKVYMFVGYILCQVLYLTRHPSQFPKMIRRVLTKQAETQTDVLLINLLQHFKGKFVKVK